MKYPLFAAAVATVATVAAVTLSACQKPADTPATTNPPAATVETRVPVLGPDPAGETGKPGHDRASGSTGDTGKQGIPGDTIIVIPESK